jgi:hypothetical protein
LDIQPLLQSPQAGALFETLVLSEIVKCAMNFGKNWKIAMWRTKEGEEVDFIIENQKGDILALDSKLGILGVDPIRIPPGLAKTFPTLKQILIVSYNGKNMMLSKECQQVPISGSLNSCLPGIKKDVSQATDDVILINSIDNMRASTIHSHLLHILFWVYYALFIITCYKHRNSLFDISGPWFLT